MGNKALIERLERWTGCSDEKIMHRWDMWREHFTKGGGASWPRDQFESMIDAFYEDASDAAAALKAAEAERDSYFLQWQNLRLRGTQDWMDKAEKAEADLATARAEASRAFDEVDEDYQRVIEIAREIAAIAGGRHGQ